MFLPWSADDYVKGKKWVKEVEKHSVVMSEDWLKSYKEAPLVWSHGPKGSKKERGLVAALVRLDLPRPRGMKERIESRRKNLAGCGKSRF